MAPPQRGYETTAKRKCSCARHTETKQDLSPEQDHSRSESARSTSWAECRNKKGSAPSRRRGFSLDIPFYRTFPISAASSDGRCNTIQCVDLAMLPRKNPSVWLYSVKT